VDLVRRRQVGLAVADSGDDVEAINGAARELLGIHGPAIGRDLIHHVGRLEQVLLNLPTNAIAYAPRPDRIEAHVGGTRGRESSSRRSTASSTGSRRTRRPSTAARARWT